MTANSRRMWRWTAPSSTSIPSRASPTRPMCSIMPAMHSAQISTKLLQQLGGVNVMVLLLVGLEKSVQIAPLGAKMSEIYNSAIVAAYDIND